MNLTEEKNESSTLRPPHILFLTPRLQQNGGHEVHVYVQALLLARRGYQLTVASVAQEKFEDWPSSLTDSIRYIPLQEIPQMLKKKNSGFLKSPASKNLPNVAFTRAVDPNLIKQVAHVLPTVHFVHSAGDYCPSGTKFFLRNHKCCQIPAKTLVCLRNSFERKCFFKGDGEPWDIRTRLQLLWNFREYRKNIYPTVHAIVANSKYVADQLKLLFADDVSSHDKIETLSPPFLDSCFLSGMDRSDELPKADYKKINKKRLLFVGRLHKTKGTEDVIKVLQHLPDPEYSLSIVGEGSYRKKLEKLSVELGLQERVKFMGRVPQKELFQVFRNHELLLFSSKYPEPFGRVGPEALGSGLPVVAYEVGGVSDWLKNSGVGYSVEPGNVLEMGKVIMSIFENPPKYIELQGQAQKFFRENFGEQAYMLNLEEIIQRALAYFEKTKESE